MADTNTTTYNLIKPEIGGSLDTWGVKLNANMDAIDTALTALALLNGSRPFTGLVTFSNSGIKIGNYTIAIDSGNLVISHSTGGVVAVFTSAGVFTAVDVAADDTL